MAWVPLPALPFTLYVTLEKSLDLRFAFACFLNYKTGTVKLIS